MSIVNNRCIATGAPNEIRMILLGRTGAGIKLREIMLFRIIYSLFKEKVH